MLPSLRGSGATGHFSLFLLQRTYIRAAAAAATPHRHNLFNCRHRRFLGATTISLQPPQSPSSSPAPPSSSSTPPSSSNRATPAPDLPDHRKIGIQQELFTLSPYSPGSPIFLPAGARIFNRLVDLLRQKYVRHGFEEVITPNLFKTALWEKSGHLQNYAEDMYAVRGGVDRESRDVPLRKEDSAHRCRGDVGEKGEEGGGRIKGKEQGAREGVLGNQFALKPMNCPGHCLIFASKVRSYRDLPIRYADFGALHRNEIAGALSGLTRVRRFHQDDGHVFCRPSQVRAEVLRELGLVRDVYGMLGLEYRLALSTRPADGGKSLGSAAEWDRAENALRDALDVSCGAAWSVRTGEGSFYAPKIDVIVRDRLGREHQTATIQLDFQLPKRFGLEYRAPAPAREARGDTTDDEALLASYGPVTPVLIHRAVLGSVERLMALLIEHYDGKWPFWLNPRQVAVVTVNDTRPVVEWARRVRNVFVGSGGSGSGQDDNGSGQDDNEKDAATTAQVQAIGLAVEIDDRPRPLKVKLAEARKRGFGMIVVIGDSETENRRVRWANEAYTPEQLLRKMVAAVQRHGRGTGPDAADSCRRDE